MMKQNIKFSLGLKFSLVIMLMSLLIGALIVFLSYQIYTQQIVDRYVRASEALVNTTAGVVDWDKIDYYYQTEKEDTAYDETLAKMRICADAGDAQYIYVIKPSAEGCTFIFDTDRENSHLDLGYLMDWDEAFGGFRQDVLDGDQLDPVIADDAGYGWLLTIYTPFTNTQGEFVGYMGVDYSATQLFVEQQQFIIQLSIATLIVALVMTAIFLLILNFFVIKPINRIATAANSYVIDTSEIVSEKNSITELEVTTRDELEGLSQSLKTMEEKIQEYLKSLEEATYRAETDSMTGLLNREAFERRVEWTLENEAFKGSYIFMMVDLDNFKAVNDTWGHSVGDEVIIACVNAIKSRFRPGDLIARMGGDELAIFYKSPDSLDLVEKRVASINEAVRNTKVKDGITSTVSIGVVAVTGKTEHNYLDLYIEADNALYDVKEKGRDGYLIRQS